MGTVTARSIIDRAQIILQDATGVRWPAESELLGWLNDGKREIILFKPNAFVINTAIKLAAGTKQSLPADGIQLINVTRNMGTDGNTPGRSVRITEHDVMDVQQPDWHQQTANAQAKHYMFSPMNPKNFYVYPPQPAANQGYVEVIYGASPPDSAINDLVNVDDIYQTPLIDYILYRAYSKDSEFSADQNASAYHQQAFIASLTGKLQSEIGANPNTSTAK